MFVPMGDHMVAHNLYITNDHGILCQETTLSVSGGLMFLFC